MLQLVMTLGWFCGVAGVTYLIGEAGITTLPRTALAALSDFVCSLLYCRMCVSFWVGCASGAAGLFPLVNETLWATPAAGFVAMGAMWLLQGHMQRNQAWEPEFEAINTIRDLAKRRRVEKSMESLKNTVAKKRVSARRNREAEKTPKENDTSH